MHTGMHFFYYVLIQRFSPSEILRLHPTDTHMPDLETGINAGLPVVTTIRPWHEIAESFIDRREKLSLYYEQRTNWEKHIKPKANVFLTFEPSKREQSIRDLCEFFGCKFKVANWKPKNARALR